MSGKDEYYNKAKQQGYRARSAYKLQQLDETAGLLGDGRTVVDLGARRAAGCRSPPSASANGGPSSASTASASSTWRTRTRPLSTSAAT